MGCFEEIPCSRVVAESLIVWEKFIIGTLCQILYRRISVENPLIKRNNSIRLSLLEEDLSEPYAISTHIVSVILSPWVVMATIFAVPVEEDLPREGFHREIVFIFLLFAKKEVIRYNRTISIILYMRKTPDNLQQTPALE